MIKTIAREEYVQAVYWLSGYASALSDDYTKDRLLVIIEMLAKTSEHVCKQGVFGCKEIDCKKKEH